MTSSSNMAAGAAILLLAACDGGGSNPTAPPPPAMSMWIFQYSPGMSQPNPDGQGGVWFNFPPQDGVHYMVQGRTAPLSGSIRADIDVTISPGATLTGPLDPKNTCPPVAHFDFYFQRVGDDVTDASKRQYRWFGGRTIIEPGIKSIVLPLTVDKWGDVFGGHDPAGFAAALAQPQVVGLTFGHGCFAGHGLFVTGGTAKFHLRSFAIN